ncbi:MAG: hypothetical protein ACI8P9_005130 [Parasphingorhabdus sp.]|jgi:hypothetical protein
MLSPLDVLALSALALLAFYWVNSLKVRERANEIARTYCNSRGVQFLDASVSFGTVSVIRDSGKLKLRRVYVFSYSRENVERLHGVIIFVGGIYQSLLLLEEDEKNH